MVNQANIKAVITAEDKASAVLKDFGGNVDKTATSTSGSLNKLNTSMIAVGLATAGLVAFGKKSLDAFNAQDLAVTRLQTGINNVKSATDKHIDSLINQSKALQRTTRFSDEAVISAQGILSTFQLNQSAIQRLTPRLLDMSEGLARVTGEMPDLEGNAILVAKAIGGEDVAGLSGALRRAGVVLTKTQTDILQTGTKEERLAVITEALDANFAHMAETAGGTTAGKIAQLKNNFNDLQERIGSVIADGLNPLLDVLNKHPAILYTLSISLGVLAAAFISVKVAAAFSPVIDALSASMLALSSSTGIATGSILSLQAVSLVGWGAAFIIIVDKVRHSIEATYDAINNTQIALANLNVSDQAVHQRLVNLSKSGTADEKARANKALAAGFAEGGFTGYGSPSSIAGIVHKGEYVIPAKNVDQNTGTPRIGGTINININTGALMGNDVEARKFALLVQKHLQVAQSMKGAY